MIHITRIDEPDFGCEGAPDGKPICDKITFIVNGDELVLEIPETLVWQTGIDEGMDIASELFDRLKEKAI
jgi:hypothetical protein